MLLTFPAALDFVVVVALPVAVAPVLAPAGEVAPTSVTVVTAATTTVGLPGIKLQVRVPLVPLRGVVS